MTQQQNENEEYPHWNRVYLAVLLITFVTIVALWLFSRAFTPKV